MRTLLRRIGARTGISLGLILVIAAIVLVAKLADDRRANPPLRPPASWTPSVAATEGDDGPIADPTASQPDDTALLATATGFTTAWLQRTLPAGEWLDGLRPYATPQLIERLAGVDPSSVPEDATAGMPVVRDRSDAHAEVLVPIGRGDGIVLGLVVDDGQWLVGTLGRETG